MSKQHSGGGLAKVLIILAIVGTIGAVVVAAAGTLVYLNRDKIFASLDKGREAEQAPSSPNSPSPNNPKAGSPAPGIPPATKTLAANLQSARAASTPDLPSPLGRRPATAAKPIKITARDYASYLNRRDVLVMVDYYADWCGPCRGIAPHLARLAASHGDKVVVLKVDVDRERALAAKAGVRSIPDVRLLHAGTELERNIGGRDFAYYESIVLKHASLLQQPTGDPSHPPAAAPAPKKGTITPLKKDWLPPGVEPVKPKRAAQSPST